MPGCALPDFRAHLATDFPFEPATTAKHELSCIGACGIPTLELDNDAALVFIYVHVMRIGKIFMEFLGDEKLRIINENNESFSNNPRDTAIHPPHPCIRLAALAGSALAFP